jgi:hypothetical protein
MIYDFHSQWYGMLLTLDGDEFEGTWQAARSFRLLQLP